MSTLTNISEMLQKCKVKEVKQFVQEAIDEGVSAEDILKKGLLDGMAVVGEKFKAGDMFVPEVLVSARAMSEGMELLRPILSEDAQGNVGKVVIGTVKGDLHNVGKDLVKLLMESKGIEVKDLGEDVAPETFVKAAKEEQANILAMSAMLTSTMPVMKEVIEMLKANDMQGSVKTMIGGAPVNKEFAAQIGADSYTDDALEAAEVALSYMA